MPKYLFLFLFMFPAIAFGQFKISGRIINAENKKPITDASVFLNNTLAGSKTGINGVFTLENVKPGQYDIVVSIVGYTTYTSSILIKKEDTTLPDIELKPKTIQLKQVSIKFKKDRKREKYLKVFIKQFLGSSKNADQCKILNPEVIDFDYEDDKETLYATTDEYMIIENKALGYRIKYKLDEFTYNTNVLYYVGQSNFEPLKGTPQQVETWTRNRELAYRGSAMHFLRSVIADDLKKQDFKIEAYDATQGKIVPVYIDEFVTLTDKADLYAIKKYSLSYQNQYFITYMKKKHTTIFLNRPNPVFDLNGIIPDASSIAFKGDWASLRIADLLPFDYTAVKNLVL